MGLWPNALNNVAVLRFLKPEGSSNLAISLLAALATFFIGLDRFGGFSTGWIRYVKVAQAGTAAKHLLSNVFTGIFSPVQTGGYLELCNATQESAHATQHSSFPT
jgi:hypothetical protein